MANNSTPPTPPPAAPETPASGKGRPTPPRREREAANRRPLVPNDRKEAARQNRAKMAASREKARVGMASGDERYLPARDKGPVRRFARDFVDSRFHIAEWFLPMAVVILVLSMVRVGALQSIALLLWLVVIVLIVLDSFVTAFRLKKQLNERFAGENKRGAVAYALMRSLQMRRLRLPKPQVKRGERP